MSRLLFAAARGARIQTRYQYTDTFTRFADWRTVSGMVFDPENAAHPHEQRIHPDDEHLQYGPISTALRDRVLNDDPWADGFSEAMNYINARWPDWWHQLDDVVYEITLLFTAEALADEGL